MSLLLSKQSQLSQPLLTEEILPLLNHVCGPLLDSLQYVHASHLLSNAKAVATLSATQNVSYGDVDFGYSMRQDGMADSKKMLLVISAHGDQS